MSAAIPITTAREGWRRAITIVAVIAVPLLIAAVALLIAQQVRSADAMRAAELASQNNRALLLKVLSAHQDIETGSRGFIITGEETFLEPYASGRRELLAVEPQLRAALDGRPSASAVLDELWRLSRAKRTFVDRTIQLKRTGGTAAAADLVETKRGKLLMDRIRVHIAALQRQEDATLGRTSIEAERALQASRRIAFGFLLLLSTLLILAGLAIHRSLMARNRALATAEDLSLRREAILESAMDSIVTLNPSGSIESFNAATERMFGYGRDELDRRDVGLLFAAQPPIGWAAQALRDMQLSPGRVGASREIAGRRKDGSEFPTEVALTVAQLSAGLRYVAVIRDVSERKRVERMKSEFVSTVSHELRTPLTSIAGSLGLLQGGAGGALGDRAARLVEIAHANAKRLVRLINDILDIEKIESGQLRFERVKIDLAQAIRACIDEMRSYADGFRVSLAFTEPDSAAWISADRDRLSQVLTNILSNAVKFSPEGGEVTIRLNREGIHHRITVEDRGPGIPAEFQDRIFGKFAQADSTDKRRTGGTGLGLSISREIVRRLGGAIDFETEIGRGTRFHVDLPAIAPQADRGLDARPHLLICGNGAGAVFTEALRRAGYDVILSTSLDQAEHALADSAFDAIVVDMGLKHGAGIEIIRAVRERREHAATPLLALGGTTGASELEGDAAVVLDWLRTPSEVGRLLTSIDIVARDCDAAMPRVLHVDDDPDVLRLVATALEGRATVVGADGIGAARAALARERFDLAILDLTLADGKGIDLLPAARGALDRPMPVVVFSAQDADPEIADKVDAYLTKARTPIDALVAVVASLTRSHPAMEQAQ